MHSAVKPLTLPDFGAAMTVAVIWAFNFIAGAVGVETLPPLLFLTFRFSLVAVLLLPWLQFPAGRFRLVLLLSVLLGGLHFGCVFTGLQGTGAGPTAVAVQLSMPFSAILAFLYFGERLGPWQLIGMVVAFAGVYLLAGEPRAVPSLPHLGLVVFGALAWAFANIVIKQIGPISPFQLNAWLALLAAPQLLLASLVLEQGQLSALTDAGWQVFAAIVYTAVGASITAYGLWYYLIEKYEVNWIVPYTLLAPVLAVLLAAVFLGEPLTMGVVAGCLVTTFGVAMIQFLRPAARTLTS